MCLVAIRTKNNFNVLLLTFLIKGTDFKKFEGYLSEISCGAKFTRKLRVDGLRRWQGNKDVLLL